MPRHPSQTKPCRSWQCAPPCETRREESRSLRVQFCSPPMSYFLHTYIKVSLGIFSPSWLLKLHHNPKKGYQTECSGCEKKIGSDVGFLNTQQPKFNQNQMLGESKEFLLAPACVDSCDSITALVLKTACTHCNASDITLHKDTAWKTSAQI